MRILVTGGSGRVGMFVVRELLSAGHDVASLDIRHPAQPIPGVRTLIGSTASMDDAFGAVSFVRAEAVVHMGAWSDPGYVADSRTYADNVAGTYNILEVCAAVGLRRAIIASSAQVYGFAEHCPVFAPVDESHPLRPLNAYALSKIAGEQAAEYFTRRRGIDALAFRIMAAREPENLEAEILALAARPESGRFLLWNRTDARDIARACRLALEAEGAVAGTYNITTAHNALGRDGAGLLAEYCPATRIDRPLDGTASLLSCEKARKAFGYVAEYAWSLGADGKVRMEQRNAGA